MLGVALVSVAVNKKCESSSLFITAIKEQIQNQTLRLYGSRAFGWIYIRAAARPRTYTCIENLSVMWFGVRGGFARLIPLSGPAANSGTRVGSAISHHGNMSAACYNLTTEIYNIYTARDFHCQLLLAAEWNRERALLHYVVCWWHLTFLMDIVSCASRFCSSSHRAPLICIDFFATRHLNKSTIMRNILTRSLSFLIFLAIDLPDIFTTKLNLWLL